MNGIKSYRDLLVWKKGIVIVTEVYKLSEALPSEEKFNLISQIRRCSISIPSNIAEGYGRESTKDFVRFLRNSRGSLFELETQLLIIKELGFEVEELKMRSIEGLLLEENKMLNALIRKLEEKL